MEIKLIEDAPSPDRTDLGAESVTQIAAFDDWYRLGRNFRYTELHTGIPEQNLRLWARAYDWHKRADDRDLEVDTQLRNDSIDERVEMLRRHRRAASKLINSGLEYLENCSIDTAKDAIAAIKIGIEIERRTEGLPNWIGEIVGASDEELMRRHQELLKQIDGNIKPSLAGTTNGHRVGVEEEGTDDCSSRAEEGGLSQRSSKPLLALPPIQE